MSAHVGYTGWRDQRRHRIARKMIIWSITSNDKSKMMDLEIEEIEIKAHYPQDGSTMKVEYNTGITRFVDTSQMAELYPLTLTTFLLKPEYITDSAAAYFNSIFIKTSYHCRTDSYLFLKRCSSVRTNKQRVVRLKDTVVIQDWIFPWMDQFVCKYLVQEKDNDDADSFPIAEFDCEIICGPGSTSTESDLRIELFLKTKELQVLKEHCIGVGDSFLDCIYAFLIKWNLNKFANSTKHAFLFMPPDVKSVQFDRMWEQYSDIHLDVHWNKGRTQEITNFDVDALQIIFGDSLLQNVKQDNGQYYVLCVSSMTLTYYTKKRINNMKVEATITKIPLILRTLVPARDDAIMTDADTQ
eukprot:265072_1